MRDISGDDGQPMLKRGGRDEEIGLREGMPCFATFFDQQARTVEAAASRSVRAPLVARNSERLLPFRGKGSSGSGLARYVF